MTAGAHDRDSDALIVRHIDHAPDLLRLHELDPGRYPHLLQSVTPGPQARFDILFAYPEDSLTLGPDGRVHGEGAVGGDFLAALDLAWQCAALPVHAAHAELPFRGGWFLYLGYELAGQIEPRLHLPGSDTGTPVAVATRFRTALIRDHQKRGLWLIAEPAAQARVGQMLRDIARVAALPEPAMPKLTTATITEDDPAHYLTRVRRVLAYIRDGDVFQANLARRWTAQFAQPVPASALYRRLRLHNPAPFSGLASWPGHAVISSSPERLVRVRQGVIDTRPIAGTRPRAQGADSDRALSRELLAHPKERAEHV
ncbi:MAG: chorismate-binding protein, partial [Gammaproteobacteria bacterium]